MRPCLVSAGLPLGSFVLGHLWPSQHARDSGVQKKLKERRSAETSESQSVARMQKRAAETGCRGGLRDRDKKARRGLSQGLDEDLLAKAEAPP